MKQANEAGKKLKNVHSTYKELNLGKLRGLKNNLSNAVDKLAGNAIFGQIHDSSCLQHEFSYLLIFLDRQPDNRH